METNSSGSQNINETILYTQQYQRKVLLEFSKPHNFFISFLKPLKNHDGQTIFLRKMQFFNLAKYFPSCLRKAL